MKICPRCKQETLYKEPASNSLSRRDNKTYICSLCGNKEAAIDYALAMRKSDLILKEMAERERQFLSIIKSKGEQNENK